MAIQHQYFIFKSVFRYVVLLRLVGSWIGFYGISTTVGYLIPNLLYNFFILSFFVGYILSFRLVRLRTFRLSARVGTNIECRCSRSCGEGVTITDFTIKTPDRKYVWGCEWRNVWKRWAGILGYFEKSSELRFEPRRDQLGLGGSAARCRVRWNSQHSKNCVSFSSCWKPKSQEGNKSFVPELPRVVSVSNVFRIPMHVNVFTYPYISRIRRL